MTIAALCRNLFQYPLFLSVEVIMRLAGFLDCSNERRTVFNFVMFIIFMLISVTRKIIGCVEEWRLLGYYAVWLV
jgi:hypothetical protein